MLAAQCVVLPGARRLGHHYSASPVSESPLPQGKSGPGAAFHHLSARWDQVDPVASSLPRIRSARNQLLDVFRSALAAVNGATRVSAFLRTHPLSGTVYVIAMGKAACPMARAAGEVLGVQIGDAWVVTKYGHAEHLPWPVLEAGHPLPDEHSIEAGTRLLEFVRNLPPDASVLVLLSGGASALVECPVRGIGLDQLRAVNEWLLAAGLEIGAMNAVRKRLSRIKSGRLAGLLAPRSVLCLAVSDVPGNDIATIGSGLLVRDERVAAPLPVPMPSGLRALIEGAVEPGDPAPSAFEHIRYHVIATLEDAMQAAAAAARGLGYGAQIHVPLIAGDAVENGRQIARPLLGAPESVMHIWGGETNVRLPPRPGRGGRNQSLALAAARLLCRHSDALLLAAGTDGSDGPGRDAGALVDGGTIARGRAAGLDPEVAISNADAGSFLEASSDLLYTGPTGTNVADLVLGLKSGSGEMRVDP